MMICVFVCVCVCVRVCVCVCVTQVGDGNINFVYIIEGPSGALALKQCLPFVRCVGESWPLTQVEACDTHTHTHRQTHTHTDTHKSARKGMHVSADCSRAHQGCSGVQAILCVFVCLCVCVCVCVCVHIGPCTYRGSILTVRGAVRTRVRTGSVSVRCRYGSTGHAVHRTA